MRNNAKGGVLTEADFHIPFSLYTPKRGYAIMQFIEKKRKDDFRLVLALYMAH